MDLSLYLVTDEKIGLGRPHTYLSQQALEGGVRAVQLRDKQKSSRELYDIGLRLRKITKKFNALFIVNDRLDIALATEADGVHLGKDDLPISVARSIAGKNFIIGASVSTVAEAVQAQREGASYLSAQSIFKTTSKDDVGVVGLNTLRKISGQSRIPVIAIGGINTENVEQVIGAGAAGVAVISAIVAKKDVKSASLKLKEKIDKQIPPGKK
ncbi:MAG: thiamine phosphate synthase [Actinomycetota bacterium]